MQGIATCIVSSRVCENKDDDRYTLVYYVYGKGCLTHCNLRGEFV